MALRHLLDISSLTAENILEILDSAKKYFDNGNIVACPQTVLQNKIVMNLFFENSTRTLCSFEIAEKKLGAQVLTFNSEHSSTKKGETLEDTILNMLAFGVNCFVVRHNEKGAPQKIAVITGDRAHVINAGDGTHAHPTQALLDVFTILQHKSDLAALKIAIIGDIEHSRVARSLTAIIRKLGNQNIYVSGPSQLLPKTYDAIIVDKCQDAIKEADVIVMLRIQRERLAEELSIDPIDYFHQWGLTEEKLKWAKKDAIVMHPGPMNREIEIASSVADGSRSVILEQARNGVAIRMAVLETLFK